jgi:hypothetical protein
MRIHDFSHLKVAEQAQLKSKLDALLAHIVGALPAEDCIVLDAPDGNAIVFLQSPGAALQTAERALVACAGLPFCIGINHGPVQVASCHPDAVALMGDGLLAAITAAEFSRPGRLLATRAFRDALEAGAPLRAQGLIAAGVFTDSRVRSHEMFAFDASAARRHRRRLLGWGALGICAILATGYGVRVLRLEMIRAARPAVILFEIRPHGEIFIDGVSRGKSPPLTQVEVKAGGHKIEVRNGTFTPLVREVNLAPGDTTTIAHRFIAAQKPTGFWQNLRRKFGSDK